MDIFHLSLKALRVHKEFAEKAFLDIFKNVNINVKCKIPE